MLLPIRRFSQHKSGKTPFIFITLNKTAQSAVRNSNEIKKCMEQSYDKEWERFTHCQMEGRHRLMKKSIVCSSKDLFDMRTSLCIKSPYLPSNNDKTSHIPQPNAYTSVNAVPLVDPQELASYHCKLRFL